MQKDKTEKVQEKVYYQWIKGDNSGNVVTIKDTDDKWINFNEGGRLAKDLQDEFIQLLDEDIAGEFIKPPVSNDPLNVSAKEKTTLVETALSLGIEKDTYKFCPSVFSVPISLPDDALLIISYKSENDKSGLSYK